jgi:uncharacterized protein YuzE
VKISVNNCCGNVIGFEMARAERQFPSPKIFGEGNKDADKFA